MKLRLLIVAAALVCATPAWAQDDDSLVQRFTRDKKAKRSSVASKRGTKLSIGGRKSLTIGELTDEVFEDERDLAKEFKGARSALLDDPETTEEVLETDDAVVITTSTKVTVVDPDAMRKKSKRFGAIASKKQRDAFKLSSLSKAEKDDFDKLFARMKKLPPKHPLRKAADKGEDALLDAIIDGQGDVTVTSTIVVPKKPLERNARGQLQVRSVDKDGNVDFRRTRGVDTPAGRAARVSAGRDSEVDAPETTERGTSTSKAKFLTGFTEADDFIWEKRWDFSFGHVSVKFHPWYEFGLRVPVQIKGVLEPKKIVHTGPSDEPAEFTVSLTADAFDAHEAYYEEVGLDRTLIEDGNEFLLGAGFEIVIRVKAGKIVDKKWTIPKNAAFDMSQNFDPPFGNCGTKCGFEVWIDPTVTHTKISLLGIVTGAARLGFNVSGKGEASAQLEMLDGNDTVASWEVGHKGEKRKTHRVFFGDTRDVHKFAAEAGKNIRAGRTKPFGYKLSDPRYDWSLVVTPGIKANIHVKAKPLLNDNFPIGPKWFDSFAIKLGTVKLGAHRGTTHRYKIEHGEKIWRDR